MTRASWHYHTERIWSNAARRKDVDHYAQQKANVAYWIIRDQDWIALRWCHVLELDTGVVRFTNKPEPSPPRNLWPCTRGTYLDRRVELTLSADELDEPKYARIAKILSYPERALDWELLQEIASDTNLWSTSAIEAAAAARKKGGKQTSHTKHISERLPAARPNFPMIKTPSTSIGARSR